VAPNSASIEPRQLRRAVASLEASQVQWEADPKNLKATVSQQAKLIAGQEAALHNALSQIKDLTASLKEQAFLLRRVSAQMQGMRSAPQVVSNNYWINLNQKTSMKANGSWENSA